jgi:predicted dehydrogenase
MAAHERTLSASAESLRVGVVGGGFIAQAVHLPLLRELPELFSLRALAEPSRRVRDALAARHSIPDVHADHRAMLDAGGLDAVVVCAPDALHERVVLEALDAGLHVLVEKPLCLGGAGAVRITERAAAAERVVQVGYMKRFAPAYEALLDGLPRSDHALVHVGTLTCDPRLAVRFAPRGLVAPTDLRPADVEAVLDATVRQAAEATGEEDPELARAYAGAFAGALIHDINAVHGLLEALGAGSGVVVDAFGDRGAELAGGTVALADGVRWSMAWMLIEHAGAFAEELRVYARDGVRTLRFPAPYLRAAAATLEHVRADGRDGVRSSTAAAHADLYERQLRHFHACVRDGQPCRTPPSQARRDIVLASALFRAWRTT